MDTIRLNGYVLNYTPAMSESLCDVVMHCKKKERTNKGM